MAPRRVHCVHCQQTFIASDRDTCPLCRKTGGLIDADSDAALMNEVLAKKRQAELSSQQPVFEPVNAFAAFQLFRLFIAGAFLLAFGIGLLFWELTENAPSFWGIVRSLVISLAGFALVGIICWRLVNSRQ